MEVAMSCCSPSPFLGKFRTPFYSGISQFREVIGSSTQTARVTALFWGPKKVAEPKELNFSLGSYALAGSSPEGVLESEGKPKVLSISVLSSISDVSPGVWDACTVDATGPEKFNPFLTHAFLSSLEESGSAVKETGWMPCHIIAKDESDNIVGAVPLYLKSHSYGEFVFDHSWADAYRSFGSRYYPKLQCCVPFTPVTGPRILVCNTSFKDQVFEILISALKDLTAKFQISSLHITFPSENEWCKLSEQGFLQRIGMQYHWKNLNYKSFDEFLMDMKQSKRKNIRQERKKIFDPREVAQMVRHVVCYHKILQQNLTMKRLRGHEIKPYFLTHVLAATYHNLRSLEDTKMLGIGIPSIIFTETRQITSLLPVIIHLSLLDILSIIYRWGTPYLTRDFFHIMASKMGDQVLLVIAEEGEEMVAGALNLIGGDALYGRLWGCHPRKYYPSLHFEACYYQAIEAAIELNLKTVEAGAQGEHKIQRGYLPVTTYSSHYLMDEGFRTAIKDFLDRESAQVKLVMKLLHESGPFKEGIHQNHQYM
ncbi:hypothetical protein G4B88_002469 [Cannabis sativa]|uniref:Acyl-CoA N-acyltransferase n=1 Tax=Cannabis sativa TaxID=3483 RepID=A0A7J6I8G4_CANSA|nr:hypothetical protein G4B88_002469 [Cannabis sativa]